jgi:hypothetical protein
MATMTRTLIALLTLAVSPPARGAPAAEAASGHTPSGPQAASSSVPTAAFAPDGTLWVTWVDGGHVSVGSSTDRGRTFSAAVGISPDAESIDANGEARPKIAVGPKGDVYVSYTRKGEKPFTGDIRFSRRLPDGRFSPPVTVNDDGLAVGHRFDTLAVSPDGVVHVVWIDKRDVERAKESGRPYSGAALYHATSTDGGRTFSPNRKIKDEVCECCRIALAWDAARPVLFWRDILDGRIRDHAFARPDGAEAPVARRATEDGWEIAGCPHHGPALAIGGEGAWHLAWFTGEGKSGQGIFYRRSINAGRDFSEPMRLGTARAGRPAVAAAGSAVWLAWKETSGDGATLVRAASSADGGASWSEAREVARTSDSSDHPLLITRGREAFLSWFTRAEGYRLLPID